MKKHVRGNALLLLAAFIWGMAFVAQSEGMKYIGPYAFICSRSFLASFALAVFLFIRKKAQKRKKNDTKIMTSDEGKRAKKTLVFAGISCGIVLFLGMTLQQIGILYSPDPGKAGFLTAL